MNILATLGVLTALFAIAFVWKLRVASRPDRTANQRYRPRSLEEKQTQIEQLIAAGDKLRATKLVRRWTGWSLKDSSQLVESWQVGRSLIEAIGDDRLASRSESLTQAQEAEIRTLNYSGQKVTAVRRVRQITGLGLADAKKIVDRLS